MAPNSLFLWWVIWHTHLLFTVEKAVLSNTRHWNYWESKMGLSWLSFRVSLGCIYTRSAQSTLAGWLLTHLFQVFATHPILSKAFLGYLNTNLKLSPNTPHHLLFFPLSSPNMLFNITVCLCSLESEQGVTSILFTAVSLILRMANSTDADTHTDRCSVYIVEWMNDCAVGVWVINRNPHSWFPLVLEFGKSDESCCCCF